MGRVNFRSIRDRFTHIDAEFVACSCTFGSTESFYKVKFYPWWEHPLYIKARDENRTWEFKNTHEGAKEVTVYPINPLVFHVSRSSLVTDWAFYEEHPLLWEYEDTAEIYCNSRFSMAKLVSSVLKNAPAHTTRRTICEYLNPRTPLKIPCSLGTLPATLFQVVRTALDGMGVSLFIPREPDAKPLPVVFLMDGRDFIVADDFELDVPDFEHRPEWFEPQ